MERFLDEASVQLDDIPSKDAIHECGIEAITTLHADPKTAIGEADAGLRVFPFKDVRTCWRRLYTDACIRLAVRTVRDALSDSTAKSIEDEEPLEAEQDHDAIQDADWRPTNFVQGGNIIAGLPDDPMWLTQTVLLLDMALIMTGGCGREELIKAFFAQLERYIEEAPDDAATSSPPARKRIKRSIDSAKDIPTTFPASSLRLPVIAYPIKRCAMTLSAFQAHLDSETPTPLVLQGVTDHWSSEQHHMWHSPEYLLSKTLGGRRLVPVELGRSYTDEGWGQKVMPFRKFMNEYLLADASKREGNADSKDGIAYLAQHDLFAQIPALRKDIAIPDLCYTDPPETSARDEEQSNKTKKLDEPQINVWLGPAGTISPLHTDPTHNILCQLVGKKYVRLYAPSETKSLEPRGQENGVDMSNTSGIPVDVVEMGALGAEDAEEDRWDRFESARYFETILSENESLYIPVGWWHYVRSLSVSCSVSFWWN